MIIGNTRMLTISDFTVEKKDNYIVIDIGNEIGPKSPDNVIYKNINGFKEIDDKIE